MTTQPKPRKTRSDSQLDTLPAERHAELVAGLLCGWSYAQAQEWLAAECGMKVYASSLTPFYRRHIEPVLRERKQFAALSAKTLAYMAKESEAFDAAAIAELKEYAYRLIRDPDGDPEAVRKWMETLIRAQAGQRDSRKLAMLEAKAKRLDALEAKAREIRAEGGLSEETLEMLEKQLKLL